MNVNIEWCTELYPSKEEDNVGVAGDFAVVRLDELRRWLEAREDTQEPNGLHTCIDSLLAELEAQAKEATR